MEGVALSYSREKPGSPKRVELLSVIAQQYTNKQLKEIFKYTNSQGEEVLCTDYEMTKARLHSKVYGPGASVPKVNRRPCQKLPLETIAFVLEFIHHPDSVEYSSHKTASCEGKNKSWVSELLGGGCQPVLWLKQNKSGLYERYKRECEQLEIRAISFSTFFKGISARNFRTMAEKAGLCNICTELGAENFIKLDQLLTRLGETLRSKNKTDKTPELISKAKSLKGYLLSEFQANLKTHSECATHCASLWLSDDAPCGNITQHQETCHSCLQIFHLITDMKAVSNQLNDPEVEEEITQIEQNLNNYIAHIIRGKYQREQFLIDINNLDPGKAIMVADYMMKLLFQKLFRHKDEILWNNRNILIAKKTVFYKHWFDAGLSKIDDLLNGQNVFLNWQEFRSKFNLNVPFTQYYGLINAIPVKWKNNLENPVPARAVQNTSSPDPLTTRSIYSALSKPFSFLRLPKIEYFPTVLQVAPSKMFIYCHLQSQTKSKQ